MVYQAPYSSAMADASRGPAPTSPEDLPAWTLVQTAHRMARRFRDVFDAHGLTAHQFGVLVQLSIEPGISQAALARTILVTPQSMGPLLAQMEDADLVRRTRPASRGASISVELAGHGRRILSATFPDVGALNAPAALGLSEPEAATLNALLHRVLRHLDSSPFVPLDQGL